MANMKAMTGHPHDASRHLPENYNKRTQLNTYIYEYFLHNGMFQCAQSILKADSDVKVQRHSTGSDRNDKGLRLKNALRNKTIDTRLDSTHSNVLPAPNIPNLSPDSCFLYEWFCLFWDMFNAQKNEDGRIEAYQYACNIQQRNWPKWNVSWPQTQSSSLLMQAPGSAAHNAFYNSGEMGPNSQTIRQSVAAKETPFQQEGKTDDKWSVQWQNDSSENQTPETSQRGVQGTMQRSRLPPVQPADTNDNAKPRSTISSLSQTSKAALPTPQLSKAAREKIPFPKGTILKKRTTNVKDEMVICKIPKLNVGSTATRPANAARNALSHINPVGIRKDAQNCSLSQAVPTGQPAVDLPLTPASMAANPPVDLVQSATFSMENYNMTDFASFPTFEDDFGGFDLGTFLESSAEDVGGFHFNYFPSNIDADNIDQS
ncbi:Transcriptional activator somA [Fusarium oxysporum f. sp. rapae]|uniref:Transcriptional activator somA n=1 Tax=Fusarium oxysporum f. sp. rapae TaxID=485398 RepID=A0A8J5NL10_FUSOX|nr:Transcriptional activator somA [Fusarium oxysporum f. sp. rapae]